MEGDFTKAILQCLRTRNEREKLPFQDIYRAYDEIIEYVVLLKGQKERLFLSNSEQCSSVESAIREKEKRIYQLQEEITDLHRGKSENAQQVIDLSRKLQQKDSELSSLHGTLSKTESALVRERATINSLEQRNADLEKTNQLLRDEYLALQTTYNGSEARSRIVNNENSRLLSEVTRLQQQLADVLNAENEQIRQKRERFYSEIADAAKEESPLILPPSSGFEVIEPSPLVCVGSTVPSRCKYKFEAHEKEVTTIQWSYAGKYFATGGDDRLVKVWETNEHRPSCVHTLTGSNMAVTSVLFDTTDCSILSASNDCTARIWTVSNQRLGHVLTGHSDKVLCAKFMSNCQSVVTGSYDRTLKVWDLSKRACTTTIFVGRSCSDLVIGEGTGANIISGHFDQKVKFWDLRRTDAPCAEVAVKGKITSLSLSNGGHYLLCCTRENLLAYLDLRTNQVLRNFEADSFRVAFDWSRACLSPDSAYCAAGSADGQLFIWNVESGKVEKVLSHKDYNQKTATAIVACSWSPCGQSILSCDKQKSVCLWSDY